MSEVEDATTQELFELGIFVQDYELHTANQLNQIIPMLKYIRRLAMIKNTVGIAA